MVVSGAACLGGALVSRRWITVVAAAIMCLAMVDLVSLGVVPAVCWAIALMLSGMLLGLHMRLVAHERDGAAAVSSASPLAPKVPVARSRMPGAMIFAALAYPMMGWLVLGHGMAGASDIGGAHAGHGAGAVIFVVPIVLAWMLTGVLGLCCILALRRGKWLLALEMGAMAAMMLTMLLMSHA